MIAKTRDKHGTKFHFGYDPDEEIDDPSEKFNEDDFDIDDFDDFEFN